MSDGCSQTWAASVATGARKGIAGRWPIAAVLAALLAAAGCAGGVGQETGALAPYPGIEQQMISYYDANASEHDDGCLGVEMSDITRATIVSDTPQELVVRVEYWFDTPGQSARQSGGCEGFASRLFTFTKSGGALSLESMGSGEFEAVPARASRRRRGDDQNERSLWPKGDPGGHAGAGPRRLYHLEEPDGHGLGPSGAAAARGGADLRRLADEVSSIRAGRALRAAAKAKSGLPRSQQELAVGHQVAGALAEKLVIQIQDLGLYTQRSTTVPPGTPVALLVKGQLVSIDEGNRTERLIIGLGAGRSDVRVWTQVYEVTAAGSRLIDQIEVSAKSGLRPGAAETMGVGAVAGHLLTATAVTAGLSVVSETMGATVVADSDRAAGGIAKQLSKLFGQQGWSA